MGQEDEAAVYGMHHPYEQYHPEDQKITEGSQRENPIKPRTSSYRDLFWAILFVLHVAGVLALLFYGVSRPSFRDNIQLGLGMGTNINNAGQVRILLGLAVALIAIAAICGVTWLQLIKSFPTTMIYVTFVLSILMWLAVAAYLFAMGVLWGGILFVLVAALHLFVWFLWRHRIPFASQLLATVATLVKAYPGASVVSYLSLIFSFLWIVVWVVCVATLQFIFVKQTQVVDANGNKQTVTEFSSVLWFVFFLLLVSFYWVSQVIMNVVHVTASGTFASWYFLAGTEAMPANPSVGALRRATTTSFGSICLGSLIVAIVQALRSMLRSLRPDHPIIACLFDCFLACIEGLLRFFNKYAYSQVAIYGKSYCQAAKDTWNMFEQTGFTAVVNDDITGTVLGMGVLLGGLITGVIGAAFGYAVFPGNSNIIGILGLYGALIGMMIVNQLMAVVDSGIATIFVCLVTDPAALMRNDPALYERFRERYSALPLFV